MGTDDTKEAADAVMASAREAEPGTTPLILAAAHATGGTCARLDTRFKTRRSVLEKLERFRKPQPPHYRLDKFNDALRYTIVYDDADYWESTRRCLSLLKSVGLIEGDRNDGWFTDDYRGLNVTLATGGGILFELQFHTPASLATAETTHPTYEKQRRHRRGTPEWRTLQAANAAIWSRVPLPPSSPEIERWRL